MMYVIRDIDLLGASRVPTLASDKVAAAASPVDAVGAASTVGVSDLGSSISPPRIVVSVVVPGRAWSGLSLLDQFPGRTGNDSEDSCQGDKCSGEGNHGVGFV